MNITTLWVALTLTGINIFGTYQEACESADKNGLASVQRLEVVKDHSKYCCEGKEKIVGWVEDCKEYPDLYGCEEPAPRLTRVMCVKSQSFRIESIDATKTK